MLLILRVLVSIATMVSLVGFFWVLMLVLAPSILDAAPMTCLQIALGISVCAGLVKFSNVIKDCLTSARDDLNFERAKY